MRTLLYTWWRDGDFYLGFFNSYPDYWTQGESKDELIENLTDLLTDLESGEVPFSPLTLTLSQRERGFSERGVNSYIRADQNPPGDGVPADASRWTA